MFYFGTLANIIPGLRGHENSHHHHYRNHHHYHHLHRHHRHIKDNVMIVTASRADLKIDVTNSRVRQ